MNLKISLIKLFILLLGYVLEIPNLGKSYI